MSDRPLPVRLLKPAQADLIQIRKYIAIDSPETAKRFINKLFTHIEKIGEMPFAGSILKDQRLKKKGYRFIIHGIISCILQTIQNIYSRIPYYSG